MGGPACLRMGGPACGRMAPPEVAGSTILGSTAEMQAGGEASEAGLSQACPGRLPLITRLKLYGLVAMRPLVE